MRQLKIQQSITRREDQSINKYLNEISKIPLLTAEEEAELAKQARKGSEEALDTLVKANLRFVVSVAKQYQDQGLSLNDLINEGNIGLIKAAQRFDETRGFKLISFAVWWIRQSILQAIAEQTRIIRLPLNRIGEINKLDKVQQELRQILGYEPTPEELAEALEMTTENVKGVLDNQKSRQHLSLDAPFKEGEEQSLLSILTSGDEKESLDYTLLKESEKKHIRILLTQLTVQEETVIRYFFGIDSEQLFSLDEIGKRMDLTRERVRQIKDKALNILKGFGNKWKNNDIEYILPKQRRRKRQSILNSEYYGGSNDESQVKGIDENGETTHINNSQAKTSIEIIHAISSKRRGSLQNNDILTLEVIYQSIELGHSSTEVADTIGYLFQGIDKRRVKSSALETFFRKMNNASESINIGLENKKVSYEDRLIIRNSLKVLTEILLANNQIDGDQATQLLRVWRDKKINSIKDIYNNASQETIIKSIKRLSDYYHHRQEFSEEINHTLTFFSFLIPNYNNGESCEHYLSENNINSSKNIKVLEQLADDYLKNLDI